jgi:hypothetical protein
MTANNRTENLAADRIEASKDGELDEQALDMVSGGSIVDDIYDAAVAAAKAVAKKVLPTVIAKHL